MSFSLTARYKFDKLADIDPVFLKKKGISLLMLDLDNTVAPYGVEEPSGEVLKWSEQVYSEGIKLFLISNSHKDERVRAFAYALKSPYLNRARKPSPRRLLEALKKTSVPPAAAAIAGDQIFTDTLAGNLAGVTSILVKPIMFSNVFLAARYAVETPFRLLSGRGK